MFHIKLNLRYYLRLFTNDQPQHTCSTASPNITGTVAIDITADRFGHYLLGLLVTASLHIESWELARDILV